MTDSCRKPTACGRLIYATTPLINEFNSHNKNSVLKQMLQEIKSERNEIAHQALVSSKSGIAKILGVDIMNIQRLREIELNASKAMTAMVCEFIKPQSKQCAANVA